MMVILPMRVFTGSLAFAGDSMPVIDGVGTIVNERIVDRFDDVAVEFGFLAGCPS
jgi:hypothetical protein